MTPTDCRYVCKHASQAGSGPRDARAPCGAPENGYPAPGSMAGAKRDLVIVGGGPAGISTALHLAAHAPALAARMVVLEKERYPRDKYCAGAIGARALRLLERIDARISVPSVPIEALSVRTSTDQFLLRAPDV